MTGSDPGEAHLSVSLRPTRYETDAAGRITSVSGGWDAFARANDAPFLAGEAVLGRPLLDSISEPNTAHLYEQIFRRVRAGTPVVVPFRCDGPAQRRSMELAMEARPDGGIAFEARLLEATARPPVALLDAKARRTGDLVLACAWCRRFLVGAAWLEVEEAVRRLGLFEAAAVPCISHGICPPCRDSIFTTVA